MRPITATVVSAAVAAFACTLEPAAAQPVPVSRVVAVARPPRYQGPCPAQFEFIATIYVNYPTVVTYRWERSDHATGPTQSVAINGAGQGVVATWQLGGPPGRVFNGWEVLHVLSPVNMLSNVANISLVCQ